jgi:leader peptidase (prepilin peptidase)/N-methyltransferase
MRCSVPADPLALVVTAMFGAVLGSFLNVCIVRLPNDQSVIQPRSRCPRCHTPIAWHDNIPIASWLLLRGKCRHCKEPISIQYPLIEVLAAALWVAAVWYYGVTLQAVTAGAFGTLLLGIGVTDARHYLIPDEYTLGGLLVGLVLAFRAGSAGVVAAVIGAAVGFGLLFAVGWLGGKLLKKEAMGGGDIKMMAMVGSFLGWKGVLLTVFGGALLGTVIFVPISLLTKGERLVPFGVFLAGAAAITFVFGDPLIEWYLRFVAR